MEMAIDEQTFHEMRVDLKEIYTRLNSVEKSLAEIRGAVMSSQDTMKQVLVEIKEMHESFTRHILDDVESFEKIRTSVALLAQSEENRKNDKALIVSALVGVFLLVVERVINL